MSFKHKLLSFLVLVFFAFGGNSQPAKAQQTERLIDLTHAFNDSTIFWPTAAPFELHKDTEGMTEDGYFYSSYSFSMAEHGGTHIDAPYHFFKGGKSVDELPLSQLRGSGLVIDVSDSALANPDYQITVDDLKAWEEQHGRIPDGSIVLLKTGYGQFWPKKIKYLGTAERGKEGISKLHFPGLHPDAARWISEERNIKMIGLDTASIDYGQSELFKSHRTLMKHGIPALENVANLDQLPSSGFTIIALPIKTEGGSGGPVRIIARLK